MLTWEWREKEKKSFRMNYWIQTGMHFVAYAIAVQFGMVNVIFKTVPN